MWYFGIWFSRPAGVGWMVGLYDLRGLFQPMILWFYDSLPVLSASFPLISPFMFPSHSLHARLSYWCQMRWQSWCSPSLDGCSAVTDTCKQGHDCPCSLSWAGKRELSHCVVHDIPWALGAMTSLWAACGQGGGGAGSSAFWQVQAAPPFGKPSCLTLAVTRVCICKLIVHEQHIWY